MEVSPSHQGFLDPATLALALRESGAVVMVVDHSGSVIALWSAGSGGTAPVSRDWMGFWKNHGSFQASEALAAARKGRRSVLRCTAPGERAGGTWDCTFIPVASLGSPGTLVVARDITDAQETSHALSKTARLHQALIEATAEIVWHYDVASGVTVRTGWFEFTGRIDNEASFDDWLNDLHPDDRAVAQHATEDAVAGHAPLTVRYRLRHRTGTWRWMEDHAVPLVDAAGNITDWIGIVSDNHEQTVAQDALRKSEERLRLAIEATGLGTWDWDMRTGDRQWSAEVATLLGVAHATAISHGSLRSRVHEEDREKIAFLFDPGACQPGMDVTTIRLLPGGGGAPRWIELRCRTFFGADCEPLRQVGAMQDVTEQRETAQRIWNAAYTDELTGVPNRSLFNMRLEEAAAKLQGGAILGLAVIDLDDFKEVNDTLGHDAGDIVLKAVAARLSAAAPPTAVVARLGGDEFAVMLPGVAGTSELETLAVSLAAALVPPLRHHGQEMSCRGSVGFTALCRPQRDAAVALKHADIAMYAAKERGGAQALAYHSSMGAKLEQRMSVFRNTRVALNRDAVMPFYQPKVSLESGAVTGFEALLRWSDGANLRLPGDIAQALEDPQLSVLLGRRMLRHVVADMRGWSEAGLPFGHVGLNVAAPEFGDGRLGQTILDALRDAGLRPGQLEIEVTESVFLGDDAAIVSSTMRRLDEAGIALALDDFGTGFASLTHLRTFPVTCLKVDRSFVADIGREGGSAAIVETVIDLAHRLGMRTVAEGVETPEQLDFLQRCGCDAAQGFFFAKPMAASRVPHFLANWKPFGGKLATGFEPRRAVNESRHL